MWLDWRCLGFFWCLCWELMVERWECVFFGMEGNCVVNGVNGI